ncbi:MAG TPA: aspartate aminotransferase family protein [Candidatus Limnocylindrales bacterium]|nr:aspartate aminotransferase family protein [Candidatus Limnocylindrales bacterium]
MTDTLADPRTAIRSRYLARTAGSRERFERAARSIPGGSTRTTTFSPPYPPFIDHASGAYEWDVDGNRYLDLLGNYTSLILGHAHPAVVEAVRRQLERGSAFAAPTELEVELAEELRRRLPSLERVRFTNSGTEATMFAIRLARAVTGRPLVARFDRSYHGTHDGVVLPAAGVPDAIRGLTIDLPWGDSDAVAQALAGREAQVAAIIVEPVQGAGGLRPATAGFLQALRALATRHGIVLVFDEIICFRIGPHGAQGAFGVEPDLTTLGKIVGGGHPLAAFGGRADLMDRFDARRPDALPHGGTFNGNPVAAAAGLATLRTLTPDVYARLDALGARLEDGMRGRLAATGVPFDLVRVASLFQLRLGVGEPADLFLGLLAGGVHVAPRGMGALSTPVSEADVDGFVALAGDVAAELAALA